MPKKKTLLIIVPGADKDYRDVTFTLIVAKTGEGLCSHFCSSAGFAYNDLYGRREERIKEFKERFGEVEVKFINETDVSDDELVKKNHEWHKKNKKTQKGKSMTPRICAQKCLFYGGAKRKRQWQKQM